MLRTARKTAIISLLATAVMTQAGVFAVSAESVARVQTAIIPQGYLYGSVIVNQTLFVSELDTGLIKAIDTSGKKEPAIVAKGLLEPKGLAAAADGTLYVADSGHHRIVSISTTGEMKTVAGTGKAGYQDGRAAKAQFNDPSDIATAGDGSLYVADTLNHRIRKIAADGTVTTVAGSSTQKDAEGWLIGGLQDGKAAEARFNEPASIAFDKQGNLYIADTGNQRIRVLTTAGNIQTVAGGGDERVENRYIKGGYADGQGAASRFYAPVGLTFAADGSLYIADSLNNAVRVLSPDGKVSTVAGGELHGAGNGWGTDAQFDGPADIAVDTRGALWVTDRWNRTIRMVDKLSLPDQTRPDGVRFVVNGKPLVLKTKTAIVKGSTYAPLREIAEALGYTVSYDAQRNQAILSNKSSSKVLDSKLALLIGGRTMMPVRELGNLLGVQVAWSPTYRLVEMTPLVK